MAESPAPTLTPADARRAARNAGAIAAATLLGRGLQFGWQLVLVPGLGPIAFGIYGAVSAFIQVGTAISTFGVPPILIRDVARRPDQAGAYLTSALYIQTTLALLAYIGLNLIAALGGYDLSVRVFLAIAGINLLVDTLGNMCNDLLLAHEKMVATSAVTIVHIIALIGLAGLGLACGYTLFGVYLGVLAAGVIRAALLWILAWRSGIRPRWPLDWHIAWPLFANSAPWAIGAFLSLAYQQADKLLTNRLIGNAETGYLAAAFIILFGVVELLNTTLLTALYPLMSRAYGDGNSALFGFLVEKLTFFTLLLCLPLVLALSLFAAPVTVPLFGEDYRPSAAVLSVLIWYALLMMVGNGMGQAMLVQNRQRKLLVIRAVGLGVNLALLALLLPRLGVVGAPLASIAAESCVLALISRSFHTPGWDIHRLVRQMARAALAGAVAAGIMLLLRDVPALGIVVGLTSYGAAVLLLRALRDDDWDLLYRLAAAMPGGSLIRRCWRRQVTVNWS